MSDAPSADPTRLPAGEPEGDPSLDDEALATLSDYLDGALPARERPAVEARLAADPAWRRLHAELLETRQALSGLQKARAPASFAQDVTATIEKRSAGRFFGRRTLGDRVPFGVLVLVALLALGAVAAVLWSSETGSLRLRRGPSAPPPAGGEQLPRP